jgi:hypothetical protein
MRLVALQSLIDTEVLDVLGYLVPPRARCFQTARWFFPGDGPRSHLKKYGFILS